jgi:hypothetical protein
MHVSIVRRTTPAYIRTSTEFVVTALVLMGP